MTTIQEPLWHDTFEDALRTVVEALGDTNKSAAKQVGSKLWPGKNPVEAGRLLSRCLDPERNEKLALGEVALILQWGREAGVHTAMTYLTQICGYQDPIPVEPEDERAALERQFIHAKDELAVLMKRFERLSKR